MQKEFPLPQSCLEEIHNPKNSTIMILGGPDTGKTTLIEYIANLLTHKFKVGIVDCDMGQSHIGPPTTIAWGRVGDRFSRWDEIEMKDFYFTGSLSPFGNLLPTLCGTKIIYDKAKKDSDKIIIDTTGLIDEQSGRVLKENKIDIIKPDIILALQRENELEHILTFTKVLKIPYVFRINVPKEVTRKTMAIRAEYRKEQFEKYFIGSKENVISLVHYGIRGIGSNIVINNNLPGRLLSIRDSYGNDLALGVIRKIEPGNLIFYSPIKDISGIGYIVVSDINLELK